MYPTKQQKLSVEAEARLLLQDPEVREGIERGLEDFKEGRYCTLEEYFEASSEKRAQGDSSAR